MSSSRLLGQFHPGNATNDLAAAGEECTELWPGLCRGTFSACSDPQALRAEDGLREERICVLVAYGGVITGARLRKCGTAGPLL